MIFLKAITTDGKTEYFNANAILTITPENPGATKILLGAGLFYRIKPESLEFIELNNTNIKGI